MNHQELKEYYRTLVSCHSELCWLFEKEVAEPPVRKLVKTFRDELQRVENELDDFERKETENLWLLHDESGRPYEEGECPFPQEVVDEIIAKVLAARKTVEPVKEVHEQDNVPNPFKDLTLEELYFLREHIHLLDKIKR